VVDTPKRSAGTAKEGEHRLVVSSRYRSHTRWTPGETRAGSEAGRGEGSSCSARENCNWTRVRISSLSHGSCMRQIEMEEHRSPRGRRRLSAPLLRRRWVVCVRVVLLLLVLALSRVLVPRHVC
jgi:hypothetical protein